MTDNLGTFDIIGYLDNRGIQYWEAGRNVTSGWVNILCPLPGCGDHSNHCGINLETKFFSCWKCGGKGPATELIVHLDNCGYGQAKAIINQFQTFEKYERKLPDPAEKVVYPPGIYDEPRPNHIRYLEGRGFDPDYIRKKYHIKFGGLVGEFRHRIIIPFFEDGQFITFTARDVTEKAEIKYKHCKIANSVIDAKRSLYNIDSIRDSAIVVEGALDVWRIGDGSVALMGTTFTQDQLSLLRHVKNVFILLDAGESTKAKKLANQLIMIPNVEIIELSEGDPADFSESDVKNLKKSIMHF